MSSPVADPSRHALHTLQVIDVQPLTDDAVAVSFGVPDELQELFAFTPGQHVALVRTHEGEEIRRSYSICSPAGGPLRVGIKLLPGGAFSTWVHDGLQVGDELAVLPPSGRFTLTPDPAARRHVVAVAAGSGVTPVLSVLASVLEAEPLSRCTLIYGNRTSRSIMFLEEIEDLKDRHGPRLQLVHVLSREAQQVELANGRIDADKMRRLLETLLPAAGVDEWFLCGPLGMVDDVRTTLLDAGVEKSVIHRELFFAEEAPRAAPPAADGPPSADATVAVVLDGRRTELSVPQDGPAVLDVLLALRPDAPYACKGGVCGTCRCRVIEGEVRMDHSYALEDDEMAAGIALACQAHPITDTVVLDFDAA